MPKHQFSTANRNKTIGLWHNRQNRRHRPERVDPIVPIVMLPNHLYAQMTPTQAMMFSMSFLMTMGVFMQGENPQHAPSPAPAESGNFTKR